MGCGALSVLAVFQPLRRDDQYEIHVLVGTERSHLEAQEAALRICKFSIFPNSTQTSIQGSFLLLCLFKLFQFGGNQSLLCTDHAHGIAGCVGWACRDIHCIAGCGVCARGQQRGRGCTSSCGCCALEPVLLPPQDLPGYPPFFNSAERPFPPPTRCMLLFS